jgi:hypothetical protein
MPGAAWSAGWSRACGKSCLQCAADTVVSALYESRCNRGGIGTWSSVLCVLGCLLTASVPLAASCRRCVMHRCSQFGGTIPSMNTPALCRAVESERVFSSEKTAQLPGIAAQPQLVRYRSEINAIYCDKQASTANFVVSPCWSHHGFNTARACNTRRASPVLRVNKRDITLKRAIKGLNLMNGLAIATHPEPGTSPPLPSCTTTLAGCSPSHICFCPSTTQQWQQRARPNVICGISQVLSAQV